MINSRHICPVKLPDRSDDVGFLLFILQIGLPHSK